MAGGARQGESETFAVRMIVRDATKLLVHQRDWSFKASRFPWHQSARSCVTFIGGRQPAPPLYRDSAAIGHEAMKDTPVLRESQPPKNTGLRAVQTVVACSLSGARHFSVSQVSSGRVVRDLGSDWRYALTQTHFAVAQRDLTNTSGFFSIMGLLGRMVSATLPALTHLLPEAVT